MKKIYETQTENTGGREGKVYSPDHSFEHVVTSPGKRVPTATNPEQLFAAAYSSCFNGALEIVMDAEKDVHPSIVKARVSLFADDVEGFHVEVVLEVHIDGVSEDRAKELAEKADQVCPYSKATRNNIPVEIKIV
ncbi:Ohr family peroxiredoxin [Enterococcus timonensis]|uniref:Ohr family peroxiredoxin n=1 Tax=Enterococcus timonensis TaxID=1852364 RepID=UPI0008DACADC|nr:Ohr family peroxiredoxin [Enterococcus timonensis]